MSDDHEPAGWDGAHVTCAGCGIDVCEAPHLQERGEPYESDENVYCWRCVADRTDMEEREVLAHIQATGP